jgi:hypothetical protein
MRKYAQGVSSSRRLARACEERVDFMAVTALNQPDFRTIADFRKRHLAALCGLFVQVLRLCQKAGLVKLGHVALDGTKIKANASKHKAMSYGRMVKKETELAAEVEGWLKAAEAAEDVRHGADGRGDEMPEWMAQKARRLAKIREAKAALAAEATAEAEQKAAQPKKYRGGRKPKTAPGVPKDKAQRNFTDPESRIMKGRDGFIQATTPRPPSMAPIRSSSPSRSPTMRPTKGNWSPSSMASRQVPAASPGRSRPMSAIARRPIWRCWRHAISAPMWPPAGRNIPMRARTKGAGRASRPCESA